MTTSLFRHWVPTRLPPPPPLFNTHHYNHLTHTTSLTPPHSHHLTHTTLPTTSCNTHLDISPPHRALRPRSTRCAYRILDVVHHPCVLTRPLAVKVGGSGPNLISSVGCRPRDGFQLVYCGRVPGVCDGRGEQHTTRVKAAQKPGRAGSYCTIIVLWGGK
jgi:hypothetical protein